MQVLLARGTGLRSTLRVLSFLTHATSRQFPHEPCVTKTLTRSRNVSFGLVQCLISGYSVEVSRISSAAADSIAEVATRGADTHREAPRLRQKIVYVKYDRRVI